MVKTVTKRYPRKERKVGVLLVLHLVRKHGGLTLHQIAFWISLTPSTHLRTIVAELVQEGLVYERWTDHRPTIKKRLYHLTKPGLAMAAKELAKSTQAEKIPF